MKLVDAPKSVDEKKLQMFVAPSNSGGNSELHVIMVSASRHFKSRITL